jgi:hypothetical protein
MLSEDIKANLPMRVIYHYFIECMGGTAPGIRCIGSGVGQSSKCPECPERKINTVDYLLKARTVEPEKQPLRANGCETHNGTTSAARQQILNKQD